MTIQEIARRAAKVEWLYYRFLHRPVMRLAHHFNWHYAPPFVVEDGSEHRWCHWCGLRYAKPSPIKMPISSAREAIAKAEEKP